MSKNMVERVARGIWTAPITGQPLGGEVRPWPPTDPDALTETYNQARAAIEAIRPTPAEMEEIRRAVKASAICNPAADVSTLANVALDKFFEIALKP